MGLYPVTVCYNARRDNTIEYSTVQYNAIQEHTLHEITYVTLAARLVAS